MERDEQQLDRLFAAYRDTCPVPDASANFMPEMWVKIDARRGFSIALRRWTGALVTAAAVLCLTMVVYMATTTTIDSYAYSSTYIDTLDQPEAFETIAYSEMEEFGFVEASSTR
jgi:hypothetical protein